jgi:hypothetical protein
MVTQIQQKVVEYIESAKPQVHASGIHCVEWIERTGFTFGDSDWSKTEGAMIFENRRAVLLRADPKNPSWSHVIFLAMFSSSLVNLQHSITELIAENMFKSLTSVDLDLDKASKKLKSKITRTEYVSPNDVISISTQPFLTNGFISKLTLSLGPSKSDVEVSRDGQLTIMDPDLSLAHITSLANEIILNIPLRNFDEDQLASLVTDDNLVTR